MGRDRSRPIQPLNWPAPRPVIDRQLTIEEQQGDILLDVAEASFDESNRYGAPIDSGNNNDSHSTEVVEDAADSDVTEELEGGFQGFRRSLRLQKNHSTPTEPSRAVRTSGSTQTNLTPPHANIRDTTQAEPPRSTATVRKGSVPPTQYPSTHQYPTTPSYSIAPLHPSGSQDYDTPRTSAAPLRPVTSLRPIAPRPPAPSRRPASSPLASNAAVAPQPPPARMMNTSLHSRSGLIIDTNPVDLTDDTVAPQCFIGSHGSVTPARSLTPSRLIASRPPLFSLPPAAPSLAPALAYPSDPTATFWVTERYPNLYPSSVPGLTPVTPTPTVPAPLAPASEVSAPELRRPVAPAKPTSGASEGPGVSAPAPSSPDPNQQLITDEPSPPTSPKAPTPSPLTGSPSSPAPVARTPTPQPGIPSSSNTFVEAAMSVPPPQQIAPATAASQSAPLYHGVPPPQLVSNV